MDGIKKAYAWQEALELSKNLVRVIEEFSDADTNVLAGHLRQAVVDVPASIAADLQQGRKATMDPVVKLAVELELVRKIYPAIDTSDADADLEKLMDRMQSEDFAETEPEEEDETDAPDPGMTAIDQAEVQAEPQSTGGTIVVPQVDGVSGNVTSIDPRADREA